jgi:DNA-binding CsgD family transcriptional regulator
LAWCELAVAEGRPDEALALAENLVASVPGDSAPAIPLVLLLTARAHAALGRIDEAITDLEAAELAATARGDRPTLWQTQRELSRLYEACGRLDEASVKARESRAIAQQLADTIDDEQLRERFLETAALERTPKRPLSLRQSEKAAYGGLTAREREVAALIAQGKTNRDIADELVLGERTIETHVGNILSKLQFTSRAQVAAWTVQVQLPGVDS